VTVRNVCDAVQWVRDFDDAKRQAIEWVKRLGKGGLIFVSREEGREGVAQVVATLRQAGIAAVAYDELDLDAFRKGDIAVAVGIAIPTNALVRGVDLPETIRYALFLNAPKMTFPLTTDQPRNFSALLLALREVSDDKARIDADLATMRRYRYLRPDQPLPKRVQEIADYLRQQFADEQVLRKLEASETVTLHRRNGQLFITFGDAASYLQASGRTSRLFAGGISRGISLLLAWDKKAFHSLRRRLRLFFDEVEFIPAEQVNWDEELRKVDEDRQRIRTYAVSECAVKSDAVGHPNDPRHRGVAQQSPHHRPLLRDAPTAHPQWLVRLGSDDGRPPDRYHRFLRAHRRFGGARRHSRGLATGRSVRSRLCDHQIVPPLRRADDGRHLRLRQTARTGQAHPP
jgi:reverse gyrase